MRIALVHSFYASGQPSGENAVVAEQAAALAAAGHEVALVGAHTDELSRQRLYALRSAVVVLSGRGRSPVERLRAFRPDVVHVHNLFPNFGRGWARSWHDSPLIATLHNFRPLCAGGSLYRDGADCTRCLDGDRWAGLRHACYRDSRAATLPLAWANRRGAAADPLLARADRVVVISELNRRVYARSGVPAERLAVLPNFVADAPCEPAPDAGAWLFAGRLSPAKGILELLRSWPKSEPLDVAGSGELEAACRAAAPGSVRFLGSLERPELRRRMAAAKGLLFPSRWLEAGPTVVYLEALAAGLPVLAFEGNAVAEAVRDEGTGHVTAWDQPLGRALAEAGRAFPAQRAHCRSVYEHRYGEQRWLREATALYRSALRDHPRHQETR
nr:glycosyltransferase family 4 protein [Streptomyces coryli]